ncbi:MAG: efflux RND transporter periplasmic adaptor subunit [Deltaproteobacteria bacterium]|nr:efflux RND transporter periplasmic adaptor subunit [Deltaproteobacteria bacterium]
MKRKRLFSALTVSLVVGVLVLGFALTRARGGRVANIDQKMIVAATRGDLEISVMELGKIEPLEKVALKSKVAGQVEKVLVDEGDKVKKGQLLLYLDPNDFNRAVTRAKHDVERELAGLELATLTLERKKRAFAERGVAQADVDLAESEVKTRRIALAQAKAVLATAADQLRYSRIVAPMDGTITQRTIRPGETVVPGFAATLDDRSLMVLSDLSALIAKTELNQIDVAKVRLGQRVTLTLDALPGKTFKAKVTKIAPASTLPKGKDVEVFPIEATLEPAGTQVIKPGMTADVKIHVETRPGVLRLPIEAVVKEKGKSYVNRVTDDPRGGGRTRHSRALVTVGARNDREIEITDGLAAGDRVLIRPASADANEWK